MTYTAHRVHSIALHNAKKTAEGNHTVKCTTCNGTTRQTVRVSTMSLAGTDHETMEVPCTQCDTGYANCIRQLYSKFIWCTCTHDSDFLYVTDGHRVFGNVTYLCGDCGMVKQFG